MCQRNLNRPLRTQADVVRRHDSANAFFRVAEQLTRFGQVLRTEQLHQAARHRCRQLLEHLGAVIRTDVGQQRTRIGIGQRLEQAVLRVRLEIGKHICGTLTRERAVDHDLLRLVEPDQQISDLRIAQRFSSSATALS